MRIHQKETTWNNIVQREEINKTLKYISRNAQDQIDADSITCSFPLEQLLMHPKANQLGLLDGKEGLRARERPETILPNRAYIPNSYSPTRLGIFSLSV